MADTLDTILRTTKVLYERIENQLGAGKQGIDKLLFGEVDMDTSANFALDRYVVNPYGVTFRRAGEGSSVRPYNPGVGDIREIPRTSQKTAITEQLRDSVIAGLESTAGAAASYTKMVGDIVKDHIGGYNSTRWFLSLRTMRTGKFTTYGMEGRDIDLEIDFSRDVGNDITYDFADASASIDSALKAMYAVYRSQRGSKGNLAVLLGSDWLEEFEGDTGVLEKMTANTANEVVALNMMPPELQNTEGLYVVGRYRPEGMVVPLWILAYEPDAQFVQYEGATAQDYMPSDEALMFSVGAKRYSVYRGIEVINNAGRIDRVVGEMVFDTYISKDPIAEYIRSAARFAFIPGDVNHTVRSTGIFSDS